MERGVVDSDYDFADTDNKFENLPEDEQEYWRGRMAKLKAKEEAAERQKRVFRYRRVWQARLCIQMFILILEIRGLSSQKTGMK